MNEELVRITCIKVKLGNRELELTPEEARKLNEVLSDLLGSVNPAITTHPMMAFPPSYQNLEAKPFFVDPNFEPWNPVWSLAYGVLRQTATLSINTQING